MRAEDVARSVMSTTRTPGVASAAGAMGASRLVTSAIASVDG